MIHPATHYPVIPDNQKTPVRSQKTKEAFIKYLEEHPYERFWQAVRNFSGAAYVLTSENNHDTTGDYQDTFYREEL